MVPREICSGSLIYRSRCGSLSAPCLDETEHKLISKCRLRSRHYIGSGGRGDYKQTRMTHGKHQKRNKYCDLKLEFRCPSVILHKREAISDYLYCSPSMAASSIYHWGSTTLFTMVNARRDLVTLFLAALSKGPFVLCQNFCQLVRRGLRRSSRRNVPLSNATRTPVPTGSAKHGFELVLT